MNDQTRAAQQLAAITENLVALFTDYCERTASPMLAHMLVAFHEHRLDLVLTAHITATGTDFICCALPVGGDLVRLFDVHEIPATHSGEIH
jgi:hypothetical protein